MQDIRFGATQCDSAAGLARLALLRSHNVVSISDSETFEQPIKAQDSGVPLLVTQKVGAGRKTYVDLALSHQLQHVHAGAFRLFANIVSE